MKPLATIIAALRGASQLVSEPREDLQISGVTDDSRQVSAGTLYCAIEGVVQDGHRFVTDAQARGAAAAVVVHPVEAPIPQVQVRDSREAASIVAAEWYGRPAESLKLLAVDTLICVLEHHQWRFTVERCPDRKRTRRTEDQVGIGKAVHILDRMARPEANMKACKRLTIERFLTAQHKMNISIRKRFDNLSHPTGIFVQRVKVLAIFPRCIVTMPYIIAMFFAFSPCDLRWDCAP